MSDSESKQFTIKGIAIPRTLLIVGAIIGITVIVLGILKATAPEAKKQAIPETVVRVDVVEAIKSDYPVTVSAHGTVQADTRGNLVSQVAGEIISVSPNFKTGGSFSKSEVLLRVDPRDFEAAKSSAMANYSQQKAMYSQEVANAAQAKKDWERLGNTDPAPDLVLRKPQLAAAAAMRDSARASYETAELNLSRTKIDAPYTGRVIRKNVALGQFVGVGTVLGEIFATDDVEVRMPLSQDEFSQLGLNTLGLDALSEDKTSAQFPVTIVAEIGDTAYTWAGKLVRTDSVFDLNTRQIDVVAEVEDPFSQESKGALRPPLRVGQFVKAQITGKMMQQVFAVPNQSVREGRYLYVVRGGKLEKQNIDIIWQDDNQSFIREGLTDGELVVTTSLNSTLAGIKAKLPEKFADHPSSKATALEPSEISANRDEAANLPGTGENKEAASDKGPDQG